MKKNVLSRRLVIAFFLFVIGGYLFAGKKQVNRKKLKKILKIELKEVEEKIEYCCCFWLGKRFLAILNKLIERPCLRVASDDLVFCLRKIMGSDDLMLSAPHIFKLLLKKLELNKSSRNLSLEEFHLKKLCNKFFIKAVQEAHYKRVKLLSINQVSKCLLNNKIINKAFLVFVRRGDLEMLKFLVDVFYNFNNKSRLFCQCLVTIFTPKVFSSKVIIKALFLAEERHREKVSKFLVEDIRIQNNLKYEDLKKVRKIAIEKDCRDVLRLIDTMERDVQVANLVENLKSLHF